MCLGVGWAVGEYLHAKLSRPEKATAQALATRFPESRGSNTSQRPSALLTGFLQAKEQQVALFAASFDGTGKDRRSGALVGAGDDQPTARF